MTETSYSNFTVWNMNGGPLSPAAKEAISEALGETIKKIEADEGVRLLMAANHRPEASNGTS